MSEMLPGGCRCPLIGVKWSNRCQVIERTFPREMRNETNLPLVLYTKLYGDSMDKIYPCATNEMRIGSHGDIDSLADSLTPSWTDSVPCTFQGHYGLYMLAYINVPFPTKVTFLGPHDRNAPVVLQEECYFGHMTKMWSVLLRKCCLSNMAGTLWSCYKRNVISAVRHECSGRVLKET